jgi:hypothetical protein
MTSKVELRPFRVARLVESDMALELLCRVSLNICELSLCSIFMELASIPRGASRGRMIGRFATGELNDLQSRAATL